MDRETGETIDKEFKIENYGEQNIYVATNRRKEYSQKYWRSG